MLTLKILRGLDFQMSLTPTLNSLLRSLKIHRSSVREAGVLCDIISSYFVYMQMKDYILYVLAPYVQAGAGT